jgi:hypothetical protein
MRFKNFGLKELKKIEEKLDNLNGKYGKPEMLCLFCQACTYTSERGIVHNPDCIIEQLRSAIYIRERDNERYGT